MHTFYDRIFVSRSEQEIFNGKNRRTLDITKRSYGSTTYVQHSIFVHFVREKRITKKITKLLRAGVKYKADEKLTNRTGSKRIYRFTKQSSTTIAEIQLEFPKCLPKWRERERERVSEIFVCAGISVADRACIGARVSRKIRRRVRGTRARMSHAGACSPSRTSLPEPDGVTSNFLTQGWLTSPQVRRLIEIIDDSSFLPLPLQLQFTNQQS